MGMCLIIPGMSLSGRAASGGGAPSPLTSLPQPGSVIYDMNPDAEIGTATPAAEILSVRDSGPNAITATSTAGSGPTFQTNVANGHAALRYSATTKWLSIGRPAVLATPMLTANAWSIMIVYRNPTNANSTYAVMFGDFLTKISGGGMSIGASTGGPKEDSNGTPLRTFAAADPSTNVHTFIYSGDGGADTTGSIGRMFHDGTMFYGSYPLKIGPNSDPLLIGNAVDSTGGLPAARVRGFTGDILRVIIWSQSLSAAEAWQADANARVTYGKALGTAGMSFFPVFDGDSQTMGTGAVGDNAMPALTALSLGYISGQYANVGKPSARVARGTANNMLDSAARDVDQFKTVTGLPIVLIAGEWYNQQVVNGGLPGANNIRQYATERKAADSTVTLRFWTSLANYAETGERTIFNNSLVSTPGVIDSVIPVHTDTKHGVIGAAGTVHTATTYTADAIHLNAAGTAIHASIVAPYVHL